MSEWTDARVELLKEIFQTGSDGWLAVEINRQTGSDFTRNAVIGARHRQRLFRDKEYEGEYHRLDGAKNQQTKTGASQRGNRSGLKRGGPNWFIKSRGAPIGPQLDLLAGLEEAALPPEFLGLTIFELTENTCHYPRGEKPVLYCGQPVKSVNVGTPYEKKSSYCPHCHSLCYQRPEPPSEKRDREKYYSHIAGRAA